MLLISGLSGAGKSTVLHALEDAGFFCTDNLPLDMLHVWGQQMLARKQPAAVCIDVRSAHNADELKHTIEAVMVSREDWQFLFVDASDTVLLRRFSTLRRRHPLALGEDLMQSISRERELLSPLREMADMVLDSSNLNPYELASQVELFRRHEGRELRFTLMSFSYRHGIPPDADMVVDARFLPNPHYQTDLAPLTGRDQPVIEFLANQPEVAQAERHLQDWLSFSHPMMLKERKQYFTLAIGCSGGRHRSVYLAERLAGWLRKQQIAKPVIRHRELGILVNAEGVQT
ncbi:MAG TPA: RNase adapter RapZ [Mariprofundaceae bacterium]|nr:RNase adapter RapZ [Mariprofundaceae bacterium]